MCLSSCGSSGVHLSLCAYVCVHERVCEGTCILTSQQRELCQEHSTDHTQDHIQYFIVNRDNTRHWKSNAYIDDKIYKAIVKG